MRIATWNINGVRARLEYVLCWLKDRKPDLVAFQELKAQDENMPFEAFQDCGYHVACHGQKGWNGVAILSRLPIEEVERGLPGQNASGARVITTTVEGLSFTSVYCPNGKDIDHSDYGMKLEWFDALAGYCAKLASFRERVVVCGDFNIVRAPIDSHLGEEGTGRIFHTAEERDRMQALLDIGFLDLFRELNPDKQAFSWWDYRAGSFQRGMGLRIDLILGTREVRERTGSVTIDRDYRKKVKGLTASDHCPVFADLIG